MENRRRRESGFEVKGIARPGTGAYDAAMDATKRFSDRVADYVKYRPGYPAEIVGALRELGILNGGREAIADVGSGTGLLTRVFLEAGHEVIGVEPNDEMRAAGDEQLKGFSRFHSVEGTAEATGLPDASVDVVAAGQAFHWFDREKARAEFRRILRGRTAGHGGWVVLVWNERLTENSVFLAAYEEMLQKFAGDYGRVDHRRINGAVLAEFYGADGFVEKAFANRQVFDLAGFKGRILSSSYVPKEGKGFEGLVRSAEAIFKSHAREGRVSFEYKTRTYAGRLA